MSDPFPRTRWSLVCAAGSDADGAGRQQAFAELYLAYRRPLELYAQRHVEDVEDCLQAFFAHLIDRNLLTATPERVRFRAFLLTAFKGFLVDRWRHERARRRGGGAVEGVSRIEQVVDAATPDLEDPERLYHRAWALAAVERAFERVRAAAERQGRAETVEALREHVLGEGERGDYARLAERLGTSEQALRVAVHRLKGRFRNALTEEIAQTLSDPTQIEAERRFLIDSLA